MGWARQELGWPVSRLLKLEAPKRCVILILFDILPTQKPKRGAKQGGHRGLGSQRKISSSRRLREAQYREWMGMEGGGDEAASRVAPLGERRNDFWRLFQCYLDRSTPHAARRWIGTLAAAAIYVLRVYYVRGFYVVSYGLGIYILNLLIGFLSPKADPQPDVLEGPSLPTEESHEFKPFVRRLPEFKFWYSITKAFCVAFLMTFMSVLDVPVFWPILLCYWVALFILTMKRQITHMIKYKYVPFSFGKQRYTGKKTGISRD